MMIVKINTMILNMDNIVSILKDRQLGIIISGINTTNTINFEDEAIRDKVFWLILEQLNLKE